MKIGWAAVVAASAAILSAACDLNPQPLPPGESPDATACSACNAGATGGQTSSVGGSSSWGSGSFANDDATTPSAAGSDNVPVSSEADASNDSEAADAEDAATETGAVVDAPEDVRPDGPPVDQ